MGYFLGVDIGSASTKGVVLDENNQIVAQKTIRTKPKHREGIEILCNSLRLALSQEKIQGDILYCIGTGYGRNNISLANKVVTEISCHARGVHYYFPQVKTIIDIGGQDSKVICINEKGNVDDFVMNEKCAAGTGRFLELVSKILQIPLEDLGKVSMQASYTCKISSTCVVFAESEIISRLAEGVEQEAILKGVHAAVVSRVLGMAKRIGIKPPVVFTGGVGKNLGIIHEVIQQLGIRDEELLLPENPQITGALGAAILAKEEYTRIQGQRV